MRDSTLGRQGYPGQNIKSTTDDLGSNTPSAPPPCQSSQGMARTAGIPPLCQSFYREGPTSHKLVLLPDSRPRRSISLSWAKSDDGPRTTTPGPPHTDNYHQTVRSCSPALIVTARDGICPLAGSCRPPCPLYLSPNPPLDALFASRCMRLPLVLLHLSRCPAVVLVLARAPLDPALMLLVAPENPFQTSNRYAILPYSQIRLYEVL